MRRTFAGTGLAAVVVLVTALPASAVGSTQVQSPFDGSTITSATPVRVRVPEKCTALENDTASAVRARLATEAGAPIEGANPASLSRTRACSSNDQTSEWGGVNVDPAAPTAFFGAGAAPMCNGRWRVQAQADGGSWGTGVVFTVSRPPVAPSGVSAVADGDNVRVTWQSNPERDIAGYRVDRRRAGGSWGEVASVGASSTSATDRDVAQGSWEYRVVALRGDGAGTAPCADTDPDLATASAARSVSVAAPAPQPSPSPTASPSPGGGSTGGTTTGGSTGSGGDTGGSTGDGTSGGSGDGTTSGGDGGGSTDGSGAGSSTGESSGSGGGSTRPPARRVGAPPPAVRTGPDLSSPELPAVAAPESEERYYGEGEGFSEEIDYGTASGVEGTESGVRRRTTLETRVVPQAVHEFVNRYVDPDRVLKPVAAGLVLVAFALHLRRWTREHDVVRE